MGPRGPHHGAAGDSDCFHASGSNDWKHCGIQTVSPLITLMLHGPGALPVRGSGREEEPAGLGRNDWDWGKGPACAEGGERGSLLCSIESARRIRMEPAGPAHCGRGPASAGSRVMVSIQVMSHPRGKRGLGAVAAGALEVNRALP